MNNLQMFEAILKEKIAENAEMNKEASAKAAVAKKVLAALLGAGALGGLGYGGYKAYQYRNNLLNQIEGLQGTVGNLRGELSGLKGRMGELQNTLADYEKMLDAAEAGRNELMNVVEDQRAKIQALQEALNEAAQGGGYTPMLEEPPPPPVTPAPIAGGISNPIQFLKLMGEVTQNPTDNFLNPNSPLRTTLGF